MLRKIFGLFCFLTLVLTSQAGEADAGLGSWRVVLQSPGGPLPFTMTVARELDKLKATVHNGDEQLVLDIFTVTGDQVRFGFDHYDSVFEGTLSVDKQHIQGTWSKPTGLDTRAKLAFTAELGAARFPSPATTPAQFAGTWAVTFQGQSVGEKHEAVGIFSQQGTRAFGTFLTTTGDYRYLEGVVDGQTMTLSCFDGGHAFLFKAQLEGTDTLKGEFWSRDTWHERWTAKRDPKASLPDAFSLTHLKPGHDQFRFNFPDLEGRLVNQDDARFQGKVRLITIFGSWCPNCNDEATFLQQLYTRYRDRGLEILGLAFEVTGNSERDLRSLKRFSKRHGITYPILMTGCTPNKKLAAERLPDLDHVLSFPTTLLIDRQGKVRFVHTGFSGPGTGIHFERQSEYYIQEIEKLLKE